MPWRRSLVRRAPRRAAPRKPVSKETHILLLEDDISDAELVKYALGQSGLVYTMERVEAREEFAQRLTGPAPDLILSDYHLPSFDGLAALQLAREKLPDVPFIFVTGTLGEERAIETLKRGASDYVLKTRLSQLVPAVHRALREAGERSERKRAEEKLRESHEQLRALSVYLQYVREEERTRIAREVHDELGQALTSLKLDLSWLLGRQPAGQRPLHDKIKAMSRHIDTTIHTVRRIATELRPGILDDLGLVAALEWQANDFQGRTGIECDVASTLRDDMPLDADLNTAFFRIFQETLTNIMRHANATQVVVRSSEEQGSVLLTVKDNGRGITAAEINDTRSIGLVGMGERAALLGGAVTFQSEPGQGTTVTVRIPRSHPPPRSVVSHENTDRGRPRRGAPRLEANLGR
jgi:signal transduction histidine kinase